MDKIIEENGIIYAKIINLHKTTDKDIFFTDEKDEIQFALLKRKKDDKTGALFHEEKESEANKLSEILIIEKGSARIDFYNNKGSYIKSIIVKEKDIIIFYKGGQNISYLEDTEFFSIKSEKYCSKTRIVSVNNLDLKIEN